MHARVVDLGGDTGRVLELKAAHENDLRDCIDLVRTGRLAGLRRARALHLYLTFDCRPSNPPPPDDYDPATIAWKIAQTVREHALIKKFRLVRGEDGSNARLSWPNSFFFFVNYGTYTLKLDRFEFFVMHLADALQYHAHHKLEVIEAPCSLLLLTRNLNNVNNDSGLSGLSTTSLRKYTQLKIIKLQDDKGRPGERLMDIRFCGGTGVPDHRLMGMLANLGFPGRLTQIQLKGSSVGHGFDMTDVDDINLFYNGIYQDGGDITEIALPGHQSFTIYHLALRMQMWWTTGHVRPPHIRQLTLPFPQYLTMKTLRAHKDKKSVTWNPDSMLNASMMILLMVSTAENPSRIHTIRFSREGAEPGEVKIHWDDEGNSYYTLREGNLYRTCEFPRPQPTEVPGLTGRLAWELQGEMMTEG